MAQALAHGRPAQDDERQGDLTRWMVPASILFHLGVGWIIVSQFIAVPHLEAPPEPITIAIEPYVKPLPPPPPAPPEIKQDELQPRFKPREAIRVPEAPPIPPLPLPPQPPSTGEPTVNTLPETVPAAAPRPTSRVNPKYPVRAESREISGSATVQITVAPGGAVSDVQIVSETPQGYGFGESAADAVWRWQFADAQPGTYRVTVRFQLE